MAAQGAQAAQSIAAQGAQGSQTAQGLAAQAFATVGVANPATIAAPPRVIAPMPSASASAVFDL